jgi:hypothetical protein
MRKISIVGLSLFAVLAFSAVAAASAFAESEWLIDGAVVTAATQSLSEGELLLCDDKGGLSGQKVCVHCSGLDVGTVGPGKADKVTEITNLAGTSKDITDCTNDENCPAPILVEAVHLPWTTEVILSGTTFRDLIGPGTGGEPGYTVSCFGVSDTCTGHTSTLLENKVAENDVLALFEPAVEPGTCTRGGAGQGLVEGDILLFLEEGLTLAVS